MLKNKLAHKYDVPASLTVGYTGSCGSDLCRGAPLTPGTSIEVSGTHFGFDVDGIVDSLLQPLMIQLEALSVQVKGINWLLRQKSGVRGGQRHVCTCSRALSVHVTSENPLASLMRTK